MPRVSLVIPTYNRAHLLPECLESALAQSFRDFEVIVIDDGSTDNTQEVVSHFPVRYFRQENQGPPGARNTGIQLADSEYIAFLDSDDVLLKHALEKGVDILSRHPEAAFSYGQIYIVDDKGRAIKLDKPPLSYSCVRQGWEELKDFLLFGNHFVPSTAIVRQSCLDEVGPFDVNLRVGSSDLELFVRLAKRYHVAYIADCLARYKSHSRNLGRGRSLDEWEKTNSSIIEGIFNDPQIGSYLSHLRPAAYFRFYCNLAVRARNRSNMKVARNYLYKALNVSPRRLLGGRGLSWIWLYAMTWLPSDFLTLARRVKHWLARMTILRFASER